MKHASLAALYRPQTFAQVTGQEMVTAVLSRAAAEDRVAPAYLLSGTRGVGKTTIARILAKALNCVNAPGPEPCNQCDQCRKITQGSHVDVTEIDGASNNSVEDARALRENIGYAPMEGRYKVFIIDEAHMLSRSAFNALLKTLEEPPPRVVFIFATTEAHKFPITIVSRCQHFIFKRLPEAALVAHLTRVLENEGLPFDPAAVLLIARRAAGSVRDSMSLLGQTLALGGQGLTVESTRNVLGLAGQDLFARLLDSLSSQNCVAVTELVRELLDQGADIGFFLRELTSLWRTLFLLRQAGQAVLPSLALPEDEAALWLSMAPRFSLAHIHAAWHMVLDAQRKVIHSPEPAAALELLLLNLALMPKLLPLERVNDTTPVGAASAPAAPAAIPPTPAAPATPGTPVPPASADTAMLPSTPQSPVAQSAPRPAQSVAQSEAPNESQTTSHSPAAAPSARPSAPAPTQQRAEYGAKEGAAQVTTQRAAAPVSPHADDLSPPSYFEEIPPYDDDMPPPEAPMDTVEAAAPARAPQAPSAMQRQSSAQAARPSRPEQARPEPVRPEQARPNDMHAHEARPETSPPEPTPAAPASQAKPALADQGAPPPTETTFASAVRQPKWEEFCVYCQEHGKGLVPAHFLRQTQGVFDRGVLQLTTSSAAVYERLERLLPVLRTMAGDYSGGPVDVTLEAPTRVHKTEAMLKDEFGAREELKPCMEILDASLSRVRPIA